MVKEMVFTQIDPNTSRIDEREVTDPARIVTGIPEPVVYYHEGEYPSWGVDFDWSNVAPVDRPNTGGIHTGDGPKGKKLADRLAAATRAGVVFDKQNVIVKDNAGQTFVQATHTRRVMGKYLNADLRRLGF